MPKALEDAGLFAATSVKTLEGEDYIADGELIFFVSKRLEGQQINIIKLYEDDLAGNARFVGEVIGQISKALESIDVYW